MAKNILEYEHQCFIVSELARFEQLKSVQSSLKEIYQIEISLPGIIYYNISNPYLPKKLRTLFKATRRKFLADSSKIAIAKKTYRLSKLQRMFDAEENQLPQVQNKKTMRAILEHARRNRATFT